MSVIRWEDPPPRNHDQRGRAKHVIAHELIAFQLRRQPRKWGVVFEATSATGPAQLIREGRLAPYRPAGSFEAALRVVDGVNVTYARYVGVDRSEAES